MKKTLIYIAKPDDNDFLDRFTTKEIPFEIEISEEFHTKYRLMCELNEMSVEEVFPKNKPVDIHEAHKNLLKALKNNNSKELDVICDRYEKEFQDELIENLNKVHNMELVSDDYFVFTLNVLPQDKENYVSMAVLLCPLDINVK